MPTLVEQIEAIEQQIDELNYQMVHLIEQDEYYKAHCWERSEPLPYRQFSFIMDDWREAKREFDNSTNIDNIRRHVRRMIHLETKLGFCPSALEEEE